MAEEEGDQEVSRRKIWFLKIQKVIPLREGTIPRERSDMPSLPFSVWLPMGIFTSDSVASNTTWLSLYSSLGQKLITGLGRLNRSANRAASFSGSSGESGSLPSPGPRGCPHSLVHGPFLHLQSLQGQVESFSEVSFTVTFPPDHSQDQFSSSDPPGNPGLLSPLKGSSFLPWSRSAGQQHWS